MQYGIRLEQAIEKVGEHFSVVAWEQQPQCVGRARSSGPPDLRPDHQILRAGGPVVHCLKMLISSPDNIY